MTTDDGDGIGRIRALWQLVFQDLQFIGQSLDAAAQVHDPKFSESTQDKHVSAITKKRLAAKVSERITQSQRVIGQTNDKLLDLQDAQHHWHELLESVERSREDTLDVLAKCQRENSILSVRNKELEAEVLTLQERVARAEHKAAEHQAAEAAARGQLDDTCSRLREAQRAVADADARLETMQAQHSEAMERAAAAEARSHEASSVLDDALQRAQRGDQLANRAQEAVAKLSADNVVLMLKLKKAEAAVRRLTSERDEFKEAVEQQQGPWFDDVRRGVEERVKESMRLAETLQAALEQQQTQHAAALESLAAEKGQLSNHLASTLATCHHLEASLKQAEADLRAAGDAQQLQERKVQELSAACADASATIRVIEAEREHMKRDWTSMFMSTDGLKSTIADLREQLAATQKQVQDAKAQNAALQERLRVAGDVNRQLLLLKADTEFKLMEALASAPGPAQASAAPVQRGPSTAADQESTGVSHVATVGLPTAHDDSPGIAEAHDSRHEAPRQPGAHTPLAIDTSGDGSVTTPASTTCDRSGSAPVLPLAEAARSGAHDYADISPPAAGGAATPEATATASAGESEPRRLSARAVYTSAHRSSCEGADSTAQIQTASVCVSEARHRAEAMHEHNVEVTRASLHAHGASTSGNAPAVWDVNGSCYPGEDSVLSPVVEAMRLSVDSTAEHDAVIIVSGRSTDAAASL